MTILVPVLLFLAGQVSPTSYPNIVNHIQTFLSQPSLHNGDSHNEDFIGMQTRASKKAFNPKSLQQLSSTQIADKCYELIKTRRKARENMEVGKFLKLQVSNDAEIVSKI